MPPKKKGGKKANDDWENDLGETPDVVAKASETATPEEATKDADEDVMAGGLMAALRKNKKQKAKKGKPVQEDFVDGEDPTVTDGVDGVDNIAAKAPEEATAEDLFGPESTKGKGGKGKQGKAAEKPEGEDDEDAVGDGSGLKSKKEKEKEKKEREKQRKKEQVCPNNFGANIVILLKLLSYI